MRNKIKKSFWRNLICNLSKINLSLLIGEIYIQLMNKKKLFNKLNQKNSLDKKIN